MKCPVCRSCFRVRVIEDESKYGRLYLVCYLCKRIYYPPPSKEEQPSYVGDEENKRLSAYLEFGRLE